jgi:hypothetical protein
MKFRLSVLIATIFGILLLSVLPMCSNPVIASLIEPDQIKSSPENSPEIIPRSDISLNLSSLTLLVSETEILTTTVHNNTPRKAVTWTSSDDLVATVSGSGLVSALAVGTVTITVATDDQNASCTVTVRESTGKADAPFLIRNENELRQVGTTGSWNLSAHYKLAANITLTQGEWKPIGNSTTHFTGSFNGNNKTITDLSINNPNANYQGMFGSIGTDGEVKNLTLVNGDINGGNNTGGIAGLNGGTIANCNAGGNVSGAQFAGGVVGTNSGIVANCYASGDVSGTQYVGGVVGQNGIGTVENCYATVNVNATLYRVGGIAGINGSRGTITNCTSEGVVSGESIVGGVVGTNDGKVYNCNTTGDVNGTNNTVGGVLGQNSGTVEKCYATGIVSGNNEVGGVVGVNVIVFPELISGTAENCYATGNVYGNDNVGGVAGSNAGTVEKCYASGDVSGSGNVGGVAGYNSNIVENCYATGNVSGNDYVGGVVGQNTGTVENCVALNPNISSTNDAIERYGRIGYGSGTRINNYAGNDMQFNHNSMETWPNNANGVHGIDITAAHYQLQSWWNSSAQFNFSATGAWAWHSASKLPILKGLKE